MNTFEFALGTCNEIAHCFFGNDEKCCCGQTNRRQKVETERDSLKAELAAVTKHRDNQEIAWQKICSEKESLEEQLAVVTKARDEILIGLNLEILKYRETELAASRAECAVLREELCALQEKYDRFFDHCLNEHINREEYTKLERDLSTTSREALAAVRGAMDKLVQIAAGPPEAWMNRAALCKEALAELKRVFADAAEDA